MKFLPTASLLLKRQTTLFEQILQKKIRLGPIVELLLISVIGLALFGGVMSIIIPHWWHALDLMWKMNALIFGSIVLCVPALYVFSSIRGSAVTLGQLLVLVGGSIATTALVVMALAPISWFFTWSTNDVDFIRIMNSAMIGLGLVFGLIFIARGLMYLHKQLKTTQPDHKSAVDILILWLILVCIVVGQMSNKLGPWYRIPVAGEICVGSEFCFPREAKGEFTTQPQVTLQDNGGAVVEWTIPETYCAFNELNFSTGNNNIGGWPADCAVQAEGYHCSARWEDFKNIPVGATYRLQASNVDCGNNQNWQSENSYASLVVPFTKSE